ncbi:MAG: thiamine pyrophosphate-dependent dehydrogenase E1 component subunit alpha [Beijerinckiaceae bacterium]|nr:thiamine pyrophosphate-dependent dehydrogenase E1 component subunit alpha [Beijerinckiaceae bacterium]
MTGATRDVRLAQFERMLRMRRFEEMVIRLAQKHEYIGRQHLHIGHEATGSAVALAMKAGDKIHTTHRNHGYVIACGADPGRAFAEILGRKDGLNGGKGGSWHLCDASKGMQSTSAMVGGSIALATGAAYGLKLAGEGAISFAHFGDGTLDEGVCYEAMNPASVFELPVLFVCENNSKAGQRPSSMLAAARLRDVPQALQIHNTIIDGADADAAREAFSQAADRVRSTGKPVFVECTLERWPGSHQVTAAFPTGVTDLALAFDPSKITGKHADWIGRSDPILRAARTFVESGAATREELAAIDQRVCKLMEDARAFAEASPFPEPSAAFNGVFA